MKTFAVVIAGLLVAAPAVAQANDANSQGEAQQTSATNQEAGTSNEQQPEDPAERRICRRVEENTGSRTSGRRVCMTAQQWRNYNARF